jgi:hypothetical protein
MRILMLGLDAAGKTSESDGSDGPLLQECKDGVVYREKGDGLLAVPLWKQAVTASGAPTSMSD